MIESFMRKNNGRCPEFPYFGASYPDAQCHDGFLWDLDKCDEDGLYSSGDNPPCPFCNTKGFIKNEGIEKKEVFSILQRIQNTINKYA